ncbi:MAG: hypothetical protein HY548_07955 [Elusimicrobia bacterium]|nr:hypothetical protein [Elusimicrobiota bacterium]
MNKSVFTSFALMAGLIFGSSQLYAMGRSDRGTEKTDEGMMDMGTSTDTMKSTDTYKSTGTWDRSMEKGMGTEDMGTEGGTEGGTDSGY